MYEELVKRLREPDKKCDNCSDKDNYDACLLCIDSLFNETADAIEELQKPRWIPVTERVPETEDEVVVAFKNSEDGEWWYRIDNYVDGAFCYNTAFNRHIKYWMPLPEPPKEETE